MPYDSTNFTEHKYGAAHATLVKMRDVILTSEDRWARGALALDANGDECPEESPSAVRWCLLGAALVADKEHWSYACSFIIDVVGGSIASFNNAPSTTFPMIRGVLDKAIKLAEAA